MHCLLFLQREPALRRNGNSLFLLKKEKHRSPSVEGTGPLSFCLMQKKDVVLGGCALWRHHPSQEPAMPENIHDSSARKTPAVSQTNRHPMILRASSLVVASILSLLMLTAVVPPIVADQSDRAVVNAPITLLTAPIDGEIDSLAASSGHSVGAGESLAQISNVRLDRGTLISLEEKAADAREKLASAQANKESDRAYLKSLDSEIAAQIEQLKARFKPTTSNAGARWGK